ncbi:hypothetical protein DNU06_10670 [Putridiphycobacter roseus]|uniref:Glycosyltransferase RgtA/B/C/D-like domain-containing protein n=1 Tax=Putridiphycobacter roseus TaxID=2219161 RepID=A0A2W1MY04_9FLAO|nr:hypothetical protein [Putridiphycobacter roseus]PZE16717.1 hypothetical protein DNU06_10670 [Putridiphycobacter roseus]
MTGLSLILILSLTTFFAYQLGKKTTLAPALYMGTYALKLLVGAGYIWLFTHYFADGLLFGDSQSFMMDSWQLNQLAKHDFSAFIQLIFGWIDGQDERVIEFMQHTHIWDYSQNNEVINDNRLILKVNAFIHFFSDRNPYIHAICFSFLSFIGLHLIYQAFQNFISHKKLFWLAIICFPNLCFWSSGLLKESLLILSLGLFFYYLFKIISFPKKFFLWIPFLISIFMLAFNKPYTGVTVMVFTGFYLLGAKLNWQIKELKISMLSVLLIGMAVVFIPGKLNITKKLSIKQMDLNNMGKGGITFINDSAFCVFPYQQLENFKIIDKQSIIVEKATKGSYKLFGTDEYKNFTMAKNSSQYPIYLIYPPSNSYVAQTLIQFSPLQLLKNIPMALTNTLIRPFPTDGGNDLKYLSFLSNLLLIYFLLFSIRRRKKLQNQEKYLLFLLLGAAISILLIIGLSVPIFGAIVRYKIPAELFLIISGFLLLKPSYEKL